MSERKPDAVWRLKWIPSDDRREIEAWVMDERKAGGKAYRLGALNVRIADRNPEIKRAWMDVMKRVAAEAMHDLLGKDGVVAVVDIPQGAPQ